MYIFSNIFGTEILNISNMQYIKQNSNTVMKAWFEIEKQVTGTFFTYIHFQHIEVTFQ